MARSAVGQTVVVDRGGLDQLIAGLVASGYRTLGPVVRDGAIRLGGLRGAHDLPAGWHDTQGPGRYRLEHATDFALFAWAVGPHSIKAEVLPSRSTVFRARVHDGAVALEEDESESQPTALFGVRPCEVAALDVLDRVLGVARYRDPSYARRRPTIIVTAECGSPAGTCFCASLATGPSARTGFDLALTELVDDSDHRFVVQVGSEPGAALVDRATWRPAIERDLAARRVILERSTEQMGRVLDTEGLTELLERNLEHPRWDDVAERCLACGNCTLACPTCFCATILDTTDVAGTIERERSWSSCFDVAHSYLHGGPVRETKRSRYRQWMTHKLSTWWGQFGTSGCVGCGRCITWCPVGIDITEESAAIRAADGDGRPTRPG